MFKFKLHLRVLYLLAIKFQTRITIEAINESIATRRVAWVAGDNFELKVRLTFLKKWKYTIFEAILRASI